MTDIEIVKACASAMGIPPIDEGGSYYDTEGSWRNYWPLNDDAQAMALVKKIEISVDCESLPDVWIARHESNIECKNIDLNRAICECVAKMQKARELK